MPMYSYECIYCFFNFDQINKFKGSGRTKCPKCGNTAFKIPAIFNAKIFKPRKFADGTETPVFVNTPKQEKEWMKSQGISYEPAAHGTTAYNKKKKKEKSLKTMETAFHDAYKKLEQGGEYEFRRSLERVGGRTRIKREGNRLFESKS